MKDKLTIDDLVYLAKDDPLSTRTLFEEKIQQSRNDGYREGVAQGSKVGVIINNTVITIVSLLIISSISFGIWKVYDNRCIAHEVLQAKELASCKAGNAADCLDGIIRVKTDGEYDRVDLYSKVYTEATNKPLPGMPPLIPKGFVEAKYDSEGNLIIDLSHSGSLVIKPTSQGR